MQQSTVLSPMANGGDSLFDKLRNLANEIGEGIVNLTGGKRWLIEVELKRLQDQANKETSPEATYNLLLFRKYSEIANQIKDENAELKTQISSFPALLPETGNDETLLRGMDALKSNLFWLRVAAALLSFISFVVMSTVPHISEARYYPYKSVKYEYCYVYGMEGYFSMRPFEFVIVVGVLIYLHTLVTSFYYLLPVDDDNQKYIPGLKRFVQVLMNQPEEADLLLNSLYNWFRPIARLLEFLVDLSLVLLCLIAFVTAAVAVDAPVRFHIDYNNMATYYSLVTFYATYDTCMDFDNPTHKIRASLAMLFFAMGVMALCLQVSCRNWHKELTHRAAPLSGGVGGSDIASRGIHTEEGRESFLAAPLPTTSDHSAGSAGSGDEEVEVSFSSPQRGAGAASATAAAAAPTPAGGSTYTPSKANYPSREAAAASSPKAGGDNTAGTAAAAAAAATSATGAPRGAGRGAALMRRYEGNQHPSAAARSAPKADADRDVEQGEDVDGDFEEADL